jgi:hypothetical protein
LLCEVDIAPYTKDNLIQHLRQNHPPIIVDVDSAALGDRHARPTLSKLPIDISQPSENAKESQPLDIDGQEGSSREYGDEDGDEDVDGDEKEEEEEEEEEGDDIAEASSNEQKTALAPDTAMEEMDESRSPPMPACEHDSALLHKFMNCIKKTSIRMLRTLFKCTKRGFPQEKNTALTEIYHLTQSWIPRRLFAPYSLTVAGSVRFPNAEQS